MAAWPARTARARTVVLLVLALLVLLVGWQVVTTVREYQSRLLEEETLLQSQVHEREREKTELLRLLALPPCEAREQAAAFLGGQGSTPRP